MEPPMTMHDLIEKLRERPTTVEEPPEEQKRAWLRAVDGLFTEIEGWLGQAVDAGVLRTSRAVAEIIEQDLGSYTAPLLEIRSGGLTVRLEPVGAKVAGVVASGGRRHVGLRGRVDLVCGPIRIPLVRMPTGTWRALPLRGEPRDLTEESFAEILGEVLLDE
jgi:hypothetical protein